MGLDRKLATCTTYSLQHRNIFTCYLQLERLVVTAVGVATHGDCYDWHLHTAAPKAVPRLYRMILVRGELPPNNYQECQELLLLLLLLVDYIYGRSRTEGSRTKGFLLCLPHADK